jgi:hypothetical protein
MKYYIYILLDNRYPGNYNNNYCEVDYKPFYIGKGKYGTNKIRHLQHYEYVINNDEKQKNSNPHKFNLINKLLNEGYEPNFIIVYESTDEKLIFNIEMELISLYGKDKDGGILTNIADGGSGGNIFLTTEVREKISKISSEKWSNEGNPNYGKKKEETFSYISKLSGKHWNKGRTHTDETKKKMSDRFKNYCRYIIRIDIETLEELETITVRDAIVKYNLNDTGLNRSIVRGGSCGGYYWRYIEKELIFTKSKKNDYIKPKCKERYRKKVFYKKHIDDIDEIIFKSYVEAAIFFNVNPDTVRKKCIKNFEYNNIFRYENSDYIIKYSVGVKRKIIMIDENNNEIEFNSVTEAAKYIDGNISYIVAICKGKGVSHKGYKFKYKEND